MNSYSLSVPVGTVLDFAGANVPTGYLECNGSAVSRTTYAALFAAIGTTWGTGDGSTTFNLPDLRGRTAIGAGTGTAGGASAHALGSKGGDERLASHSHNVPAHNHTVPAHKHTVPAHNHGIPKHGHGMTQPAFTMRINGTNQRAYGISASGGGTGYVIGGYSSGYTLDAVRTTNAAVSDKAAFSTDNKAAFDTNDRAAFNTNDKAAFSTDSNGSGSSGNMQPYATVKKIIRAL